MSLNQAENSLEFKTYCLGVGCMTCCSTCQHERNWQMLNELPDALRKPMQKNMRRIDESYCQISSGKLYAALSPTTTNKKES